MLVRDEEIRNFGLGPSFEEHNCADMCTGVRNPLGCVT